MEDINRNGAYIQRRKMYLQYRKPMPIQPSTT